MGGRQATIQEAIPASIAAQAEAARVYLSELKRGEFKLTGIVDPPESPPDGAPLELQLILCGKDRGEDVCLRERFRVARRGEGFDVAHLEEPPPAIGSPAPLLDPPKGERSTWLDEVLARHAFVVLVFYRGFW